MTTITDESPVTVTVARRADPDRYDEMMAWVRTGQELAAGCPGYLGGGWLQPKPGSNVWHMLYRFESPAALTRWEDSKQRAWWLGSGEGMVRLEHKERRTGIEGWFDEPEEVDVYRPADPQPTPPPRWKQAVTIFLVFFPLSVTFNLLLDVMLADLDVPTPLRVLALVLMLTPVMTYLALPWITKKMAWFLEGRPAPWRRAD